MSRKFVRTKSEASWDGANSKKVFRLSYGTLCMSSSGLLESVQPFWSSNLFIIQDVRSTKAPLVMMRGKCVFSKSVGERRSMQTFSTGRRPQLLRNVQIICTWEWDSSIWHFHTGNNCICITEFQVDRTSVIRQFFRQLYPLIIGRDRYQEADLQKNKTPVFTNGYTTFNTFEPCRTPGITVGSLHVPEYGI